MKVVGARLGDYVDLPAAVIAIFGIEVVGDNAKFRNRVEIGNDGSAVILPLFDICAVDHETIGRLALAIHGLVTGIQAAVDRAIANTRSASISRRIRGNTRLQRQEIGICSTVKRHRGYALGVNHLAHLRSLGFDVNSFSADLYLFANRSNLKSCV